MEIIRSIQREKTVVDGRLQIITAVEALAFWYTGKPGMYIGYSKKPVFVIIKSADEIRVLTVDGKPLTIAEAEKMLPGIIEELKGNTQDKGGK